MHMLFEEKQMDYVIYVQFDFKSISHLRGFIEEKINILIKDPLLFLLSIDTIVGSHCY